MKSVVTKTNPYEAPASVHTAIREVPWLPLRTLGGGVLLLGLVAAVGVGSAEPLVLVAFGIAILVVSEVVRRRRRSLVIDGSEIRVMRSGVAGAPFEASAIVRRDHHPGITTVYGMIMLGVLSASCKGAAQSNGFAA